MFFIGPVGPVGCYRSHVEHQHAVTVADSEVFKSKCIYIYNIHISKKCLNILSYVQASVLPQHELLTHQSNMVLVFQPVISPDVIPFKSVLHNIGKQS